MQRMKKAFTLIELLVVIGVLAVVAAGVVALINPQDKIRSANDAKIINDIGQLATAAQSYAAQQPSGSYPSNTGQLQTTGELVTIPLPPGGGAYGWTAADASGGPCTGVAADPCTTLRIHLLLTSLKYTSVASADTWMWCSTTGRAGAVADTTLASCP